MMYGRESHEPDCQIKAPELVIHMRGPHICGKRRRIHLSRCLWLAALSSVTNTGETQKADDQALNLSTSLGSGSGFGPGAWSNT